MEVYEKINYLIEEKKMTKQDFIKKLILLEPKLKRTGEVPSPSTINGYLYGQREIKIELIPYIAEVLGANEQELFTFDLEYSCNNNYRHSKEIREILNLLQYAPANVIEKMKEQLIKYKLLFEENTKL